MNTITEAELRDQYARSELDRVGISFERAIQSPVIVLALISGIHGRRRRAARQARFAAIQYQIIYKEATPC